MGNEPGRDLAVTLRVITNDNLRPVMRLNVKPDQEQFVAPNAVSIAEHAYAKSAWLRAIYAGEEPVGLVLLSEDRETPRYYLWRYMIDGRHQGNGYGARAMELVIEHVRRLPGANALFVTYVPAPGGPRDFYARFGFVDTGVDHGGELEMRLDLTESPRTD